jgi:peptidoglycan/LPS O-acetylase OafA/YrhL
VIALEKNDRYFRPLTGVRAIAAYMVYLHHLNPLPKEYKNQFIYNFLQELHIGVTLFFVLSGFLIAYRYSEKINFSFRKYLVNRVARIYPMYFILTTLTFIVLAQKNSGINFQFLILYILNIGFIRGFFESFKFSGIAQGWSLTVEETFYFLAPVLFFFINKSKRYLFILPVVFICSGIGLVLIFSRINFYGFFSSFEFLFNYTFFGRCLEFFIGITLALVYKNQFAKKKVKHCTLFGLIGIIVSIVLIAYLKGDYDYGIRHPIGKIINTLILPILGIAPFYYGLLNEDTIFSKILGSNLFVLLGKSSYIFYLIHIGIFSTFLHQYTKNYLFIFIAINSLSILLFKFIEEPLNNYIRKKFAK